ncbi:MAG: putative selenate reductase subunit YgfK, partial [Clostridiales bacterium]|nr:putative selenate reductase subunit YgfK [Clostridiales bacterium]
MSDRMRPIPFARLMDWALSEYETRGSLFGVHTLYRHRGGKALSLFGERLETPVGPAAGPHTQLAQNIIAAYAAGARFFELKTVQIIDGEDLPVSKPCILAAAEGYNVEWSTELRVEEAFDEYVKAWYALKLLSRALGLGAPDGFVFNMSVGYDLAGIQSEKIDRFIEGLGDAGQTPIWAECAAWARAHLSRLPGADQAFLDGISPRVCRSITLSTLHGCPPDEIERIAVYLITQKGLHTYVKCNPTLLGYPFARETLDSMGYDELVFDAHHFENDLQYADAVPMFNRLMALARTHHLAFGVKLSNTFPVTIAAGELPGDEMYMSGKSLYPLTAALAARLSRSFGGALPVSYSGGADAFHAGPLFSAGIWPITVATTLLKPGGYSRLHQLASTLAAAPYSPFSGVDADRLAALAQAAKTDPRHMRPVKSAPRTRAPGPPPLTDCFLAGCESGCPIDQDIPAYLHLVGEGRYEEALAVICEKNPLPFITGTLCPHPCQGSCVRGFYEEPVQIRAAKLLAAQRGWDGYRAALAPRGKREERVAVVGGGPAGMAAAFFLARAGAAVTLFEQRPALGGVVRYAIPAFRISDAAIDRDVSLLEALGVEIRLETRISSVDDLYAQGYTHVLLACGAWKPGELPLADGAAAGVLDFLETAKLTPHALSMGKRVAV